jgi:hypothetical protein
MPHHLCALRISTIAHRARVGNTFDKRPNRSQAPGIDHGLAILVFWQKRWSPLNRRHAATNDSCTEVGPNRGEAMTSGAIVNWIIQAIVTWWVYRDLGPQGSRLVARTLGLQPGAWIWVWLIGLAFVSLFVNSQIAARAYAGYTGKRPCLDWYAYSQSGGSGACYWCGLTSSVFCFLVFSLTLPEARLPGIRVLEFSVSTLLLNMALIQFVVHILFRRRYGAALN